MGSGVLEVPCEVKLDDGIVEDVWSELACIPFVLESHSSTHF